MRTVAEQVVAPPVARPQAPHRRRATVDGGRGLLTSLARSAISNARAKTGWA